MRKYDLLIFDLDGTIVDTSVGIYNSVRYAESRMQLKAIPDGCLKKFVGPPPAEMYETLYSLTREEALRAAGFHREYGGIIGYKESLVYEGIYELLGDLRNLGYVLSVATLKKEETAVELLKYHGIFGYFDVVRGMDNKESKTKSDIISDVIGNCSKDRVLMIGDTINDYVGALKSEVKFLGVSYGFGFTRNETDISIAGCPSEIKMYL